MRAKFSTLSILKGPLLTLKNSAERIRKAFLAGISNDLCCLKFQIFVDNNS